ncbi:phosphatase PAP2 family protein [Amnimonas aquatica]|uniref:undecaprenyl-diphosphate phosphatase n=1 Tax=Amnimonas aquatica TaxID=2094561 RepID=A0A2P6ATB9_9GAMM|nr:phosphatase PAP2 family protein [Amnimonas aquatica]PQA46777.1 phosphatase PAP2 family protein [Amnimonas aquatica]
MEKTTAPLTTPFAGSLARLDVLEHRLCVAFNQTSRREAVRLFFRIVSRLGDGVFWYLLMIVFMMQGQTGRLAAAQMGATALVGVIIYKLLKGRLVRERPFISHRDICCGCPPLDRYSFPSGHTLQAVLFTTVALAWFPTLAVLLLPFTVLVALSRMVLGLHYPTDVICGAAIGFGLAHAALALWPPLV